MSRALHIAVCGCGPAGLAAALLLQRSGHDVRLFERFDAPRPVGSGLILQPTGLGVLARLGLIDAICSRGAVIERLFGRVLPSGRVVLDVRYAAMGPGWSGLAVHRAALFDVLFEAVVSAGIALQTSTIIRGSEVRKDRRVIIGGDGKECGSYDLVVDAMGSRSPLRRQGVGRALPYGALWASVPFPENLTFDRGSLEQRYFRASRMAGILPIGTRTPGGTQEAAFFWSLKRTDVERWRGEGIDLWKTEVETFWPECAPLIAGIARPEDLTVAHYDHFTLNRPWDERLVHVGDAAHSTSPQLGQGANMALLDVLALTHGLEAGVDVREGLANYAALRRWHVRIFQWASAAFTPFYQSDSSLLPSVRDHVAAPLSRLPIVDGMLARLVSGLSLPPLGRSTFTPWRAIAKA